MSYMGFNCAKSAEIISFSSFCFCCCLCVCAFAIMSYTSKTLGNIDDKTKSPSPFIFLHKITNKFKHHLVTFLHEDRKRALTWVQRDHRHKTTERERLTWPQNTSDVRLKAPKQKKRKISARSDSGMGWVVRITAAATAKCLRISESKRIFQLKWIFHRTCGVLFMVCVRLRYVSGPFISIPVEQKRSIKQKIKSFWSLWVLADLEFIYGFIIHIYNFFV